MHEGSDRAPVHRLLSGWGGTPRSAADVAGIHAANEVAPRLGGAPVIARGLGRSYGDAALNAGGMVLDMTPLRGVRSLDLEQCTVTADAGLSLDDLIRMLLPFGLFVPVTPGTRFVTLGGALAADIHGKNHHVDGSIQRHVTSLTLETPGLGRLAVSPASHPEIFRATAGGMGLTGVITDVTMRPLPVETAYMSVDTEKAANLDDALARLTFADERYRYSVAWLDSLAQGRSLGRSVLMRANHARLDELPRRAATGALELRGGAPLGTVPPVMPGGLVNRLSISAFNEAYFRRAPGLQKGRIQGIASYFHPLDRILHWNRGYGPAGFVQYQFALPDGQERALRAILERLSAKRYPSLVTVLKRFGEGCGLLSFPIAGWTLALDFPAGLSGLKETLDECDRIVANAGGRLYLAKDARADPAVIREMYPELDAWRAIRERLDPSHRMRSDLSRRLELL